MLGCVAGADMDETHYPPENKAAEPVDGVVPVAFVAGEQGEQNVHPRKAQGRGGKDSGDVWHNGWNHLLISLKTNIRKGSMAM